MNALKFFGLMTVMMVASVAGTALANDVVGSEPSDRTTLELTVYNRDLALVREVRQLELPRGEFHIEYRGVPERIRPATLLVTGDDQLTVLEQNYEYDLMSKERILQKYVGREVAWILEDGGRVTGTLLGIAQGPVFDVGGEIMFEMPGRIVLPELPGNLRARPTLVWRAERDKAGSPELDVSYLTGGLGWSADYVLQLDPSGTKADLSGWVTVDNRSGAAFEDATLQLVAGDINQVRPAMQRRQVNDAEVFLASMPKNGGMEAESLYDYHLYTVPWSTDLPNNSTKQVSLLTASDVAVERIYTVRGQSHFFRGGYENGRQDVAVSYAFENEKENQLGMPLPAGIVRVYGRSSGDRQQLLGEDRIRHTPRNERVELTVGKAFDIVAERKRMDLERLSDRIYRSTWSVELRNRKTDDVVIEVREPVGGDWAVLKSSLPFEKISNDELLFRVPVKADSVTTLTYTVEVTY